VVGIFIVNNNPETMAWRLCNRRFASQWVSLVDFALRGGGKRPAGVPAVALIKSHCISLSVFERKYAGGVCVRAAKSPAQSPADPSRSFGEYALLEDSRYMSQEELLRETDQPQKYQMLLWLTARYA
jgi:hypothetical protein